MIALDQELLAEVVRAAARQGATDALAQLEARASEQWLDVKTASVYASLSEPSLRALILRGQIPSHRSPQGHVRLRRSELDAWLEGGEVAA